VSKLHERRALIDAVDPGPVLARAVDRHPASDAASRACAAATRTDAADGARAIVFYFSVVRVRDAFEHRERG
jgi:hypothetical protein